MFSAAFLRRMNVSSHSSDDSRRMIPVSPGCTAPYGARSKRVIAIEHCEKGLLFKYSDGTTRFHPKPGPLLTFL
jgi:hypothetical protein